MKPHSHPQWICLPRSQAASVQGRAHAWCRDAFGLDDLRLERDARGKPICLPPHARVGINWSHAGDVLLIAAGIHLDVGVDVESLQRRAQCLAIARRHFHPEEAAWLEAADARVQHRRFLQLWCAKEAVLKADGRGIAFGLRRVRCDVDAHGAPHLVALDPALGPRAAWQVQWFEPSPGYIGALAWRRHAGH